MLDAHVCGIVVMSYCMAGTRLSALEDESCFLGSSCPTVCCTIHLDGLPFPVWCWLDRFMWGESGLQAALESAAKAPNVVPELLNTELMSTGRVQAKPIDARKLAYGWEGEAHCYLYECHVMAY